MTIDQLATIITGEFGWFNMLLILITLISFVGAVANYIQVKKMREELWDVSRHVDDIRRRW